MMSKPKSQKSGAARNPVKAPGLPDPSVPSDPKNEYDFRLKRIAIYTQSATTVLTSFFKWGTFALLGGFAYLGTLALSGEETKATILMKAAVDIKLDQWVAYILAGAGTVYGLRERKLRRQSATQSGTRIAKLEARIDADRSSSGLPSSGDTRVEDV